MIKIVSLIFFVVTFVWTWVMLNSKSVVGVDIHAGIQSKLAIMIEETIKAKKPSSSNFQLLKMYTQRIDDNKVSAHFSYKFDETTELSTNSHADTSERRISGTAILTKSLSEDPAVQKWIIQSVKTGTESFDFKEGVTITSDGQISEEPAPAPQEEPKKNE